MESGHAAEGVPFAQAPVNDLKARLPPGRPKGLSRPTRVGVPLSRPVWDAAMAHWNHGRHGAMNRALE
jgi:hypothetical protein